MRTTSTLTWLASAAFASAGAMSAVSDMAKGGNAAEIAPPPVVKSKCDHTGFYAGAGVDYFFDSESEYYNAHLGYDFAQTGRFSHSAFVEAGWLENDDYGYDLEVIPVTLNYKLEYALTNALRMYAGGGLGVAFVDLEGEAGGTYKNGFSEDEAVFAFQLFAGLTYCLTSNVELYAGVRYLWLDGIDGEAVSSDSVDDFSVGGGVRVNF